MKFKIDHEKLAQLIADSITEMQDGRRLGLGEIRICIGDLVDVQVHLVVTSMEDDFIEDDRHHCLSLEGRPT